MARILFTLCLTGLIPLIMWSQKVGINTDTPQEALDVNGKIKVGNDNTPSTTGSIRFNPETKDFEGFDGNDWVPFTPDPRETFWPAYGNRGAIGSYYDYSREDAVQGDKFGYSVDIDGDYAVVGSPEWNGGIGRAFVFKKEPVFGFWNVVDTLLSPYPFSLEKFGFSVAISGNRVVIGSPGYDSPIMNNVGVIYIFKRIGQDWSHEISYGPFTCCSEFGFDVDISGDEILAGCPNPIGPSCTNSNNAGKVVYFKLANDGSIIGFQHLLQPSISPTGLNRFGHAVSLSGEWAVASSPFSNASPREDSVYVFKKNSPITYQLEQSFGGYEYDGEFGYSVSVSGDRMMIGARKEDNITNSGDNKGLVTLLYRDINNVWQALVQSTGDDTNGYFGHAVACSSINHILAAHQDLTDNSTDIKTFHRLIGPRQPYTRITDPQATSTDNRVYDVSVSGNYFIIGLAEGKSINGQQGGRIFFGRIR
ncbi:MAG: hypothetical protein IPO92_04505 [Saprospiraceae bacterium]|nr:hypothetical protein [Saprospiraceae bacterium]